MNKKKYINYYAFIWFEKYVERERGEKNIKILKQLCINKVAFLKVKKETKKKFLSQSKCNLYIYEWRCFLNEAFFRKNSMNNYFD